MQNTLDNIKCVKYTGGGGMQGYLAPLDKEKIMCTLSVRIYIFICNSKRLTDAKT